MLLSPHGARRPSRRLSLECSAGEQRRAAIARALINDPVLLLADEPTSDLDEQTEIEIMDELLAVNRELGTTLVLVTAQSGAGRAGRADRPYRRRDDRVMNAKRPDLAKLTSPEKDALIRDLWRQVAAGQSEARVLRRRLGSAEETSEKGESALLEKLREAAPRRPVEPPAGLAVKLGRGLKLWQSPVVDGHGGDPVRRLRHRRRHRHLAAARPAAATPGAAAARARGAQLALCRAEAASCSSPTASPTA